MDSSVAVPSGLTSAERKAELRRKGELTAQEAAEYLDMKVQSFYNRRNLAKEPGQKEMAPEGERDHRGRLIYRVPILDAWKKRNSRKA